ncbi:Hypothetical protein AA314_09151 [Archangium gephyra]|uniref:Uncharacterized protein n=1 Tax=Archangium gephyra TaxID=48 RepID=A0AAC8QHB5_9BACT|nr:Hypothetical protein AA314_09151 [Archangium gephyra]
MECGGAARVRGDAAVFLGCLGTDGRLLLGRGGDRGPLRNRLLTRAARGGRGLLLRHGTCTQQPDDHAQRHASPSHASTPSRHATPPRCVGGTLRRRGHGARILRPRGPMAPEPWCVPARRQRTSTGFHFRFQSFPHGVEGQSARRRGSVRAPRVTRSTWMLHLGGRVRAAPQEDRRHEQGEHHPGLEGPGVPGELVARAAGGVAGASVRRGGAG